MPSPNAKIERDYRLTLTEQTNKMNNSFKWWLIASLKKDNPLPKVKGEFRELAKYWEAKFSDISKNEATKFIYKIKKHSDSVLHSKSAEVFSVKRNSKLINEIVKARINENIALIKSIPREQILRYENAIYSSVANIDRANLSDEIEKITKKLHLKYIPKDEVDLSYKLLIK